MSAFRGDRGVQVRRQVPIRSRSERVAQLEPSSQVQDGTLSHFSHVWVLSLRTQMSFHPQCGRAKRSSTHQWNAHLLTSNSTESSPTAAVATTTTITTSSPAAATSPTAAASSHYSLATASSDTSHSWPTCRRAFPDATSFDSAQLLRIQQLRTPFHIS